MAMIRPETEMKDSGVQWLGNIPKEWSVGKVKHEFYATKTIVGDKVNDYERLALTLNGVIKRSKDAGDGLQPEKFDGYQILKEHELVFKLIDLANVSTSRVGLSPYTGIVSPAYIVLHHRKDMNPRYGEYYFLSMWMNEVFNHIGGDGVRSALNAKDLLNIPYLKVSPDEQQAIADYLDETCSKIDEIIAEAKASIDEYKELKQSVIFEAVTKGLDKNVEMKDSGVEWIGKIPKNWTLYRLKHLLQSPMQYGANATGLEYDKTMPRYVRITDIDSNGNLKDVGKQSLSWDIAEPYLLEDGDLLLARSGGTVGKAFLYKKFYGTCAFAGYLIRAKANDKVLPEYIHYYTLSKGYEIWKNGIFIKATIQNIGADKYANLPIPIPTDIEIQREVVKYLDSKCNTLDSLIAEKESLIKDLESYKKSLIYEVVTGKRRVV